MTSRPPACRHSRLEVSVTLRGERAWEFSEGVLVSEHEPQIERGITYKFVCDECEWEGRYSTASDMPQWALTLVEQTMRVDLTDKIDGLPDGVRAYSVLGSRP